jgi:hypothetical protein
MPARKPLDRSPGAVPEIRPAGDGVIFLLDVAGTQPPGRLVLRCDAEGNVWASIALTASSPF